MDFFNNFLLHYKKKIIFCAFIIIGIITIPAPWFFPLPGLDSSGFVGLYMNQLNHLQIGKDEMSQFGPLAFLYVPSYVDPSLWFFAMIFRLSSHFLFLLGGTLVLMKSSLTWKENILALLMLSVLVEVTNVTGTNDYELISFSILLLYLLFTHKIDRKYEMPLLIFVSFSLAVVSLIKYEMTIASLSIIAMFSVISIFSKDSKRVLSVCASYGVSLLILWDVSGQHLSNLLPWFTNNLEFSSAYSYGQALDGSKYQIIEGVIGVIYVIFLLTYSVVKKLQNLSIFTLLSSVLFFITFKHGFVRQDLHVLLFFFFYGLFFIIAFIIYKNESTDRKRSRLTLKIPLLILSIIYVGNVLFLSLNFIAPSISAAIPMYDSLLPLIFDHSTQAKMIESAKDNARNYYQLDNKTIDYIGNKTIDIIPWAVDIPWAYDLNWSPRSMWQSFAVFTSQADELNAQHFVSEKSPQTILYAYESTDNRYPFFDEPLTQASILRNYHYVRTDGEFLLLSHNENERVWGPEKNLGSVNSQVGKLINVPKYTSGYEFANIDLRFSALGKFMNTIYKPALAHIKFRFSDQSYSKEFRFLPGTANDGIFISQYIDNVYDLKPIFSGEIKPDIDAIIIYVDDPRQYENNIQIKFVGVPAQVSVQNITDNTIPNWHLLNFTSGGLMAIDWIDNMQYAKQGSIVNINNDTGEFLPISGWAVDNLAKDGTVKTFLVFKDGQNEIVLPTKKEPRSDLVSAYGVHSYIYGGWETVIDKREFGHGCYALSLRIPRSADQEYFDIDGGKSICFN